MMDPSLQRAAARAAALASPARLRVLQLLFDARPHGLVVGDIRKAVQLPGSTLSHHLERLRAEGLVNIRRHGTFLWCSANEEHLRELAGFLLGLSAAAQNAEPGESPQSTPPPEIDIEFD